MQHILTRCKCWYKKRV